MYMSSTSTMSSGPLGPIRSTFAPRSISQRVSEELRMQIAEGVFLPGERVNEAEVAAAFEVSRNTLREAFAELAAERLIVRTPNRGARVAVLGGADVRDVYLVRRVTEVGALHLIRGKIDVGELGRAVAEGFAAQDAEDLQALGSANTRFHRELVRLAGSPRLDEIMSHLLAELRLLFLQGGMQHGLELHSKFVDWNNRIYFELSRPDYQIDTVAQLLSDYLQESERDLSGHFAEADPGSES